VDAESLATLRAVAGNEAGIPESLHARLRGESIAELREDARQLAIDTGYATPPPPPARNERGQFARGESGHQAHRRFNDAVRAGFGFPTSTEQPEQLPQGDLGVGRGGGALPRQVGGRASMNDLLRAAAGAKTMVADDLAQQLAVERVRGG
jgi:hypothetical protein